MLHHLVFLFPFTVDILLQYVFFFFLFCCFSWIHSSFFIIINKLSTTNKISLNLLSPAFLLLVSMSTISPYRQSSHTDLSRRSVAQTLSTFVIQAFTYTYNCRLRFRWWMVQLIFSCLYSIMLLEHTSCGTLWHDVTSVWWTITQIIIGVLDIIFAHNFLHNWAKCVIPSISNLAHS